MSSTTETRTVIEQIVDNAEERELYIVSKEMERPPYWFADEGMNARLGKALRRCLESGIERLPNGDHVVKGSAGRLYIVKGSACECPASQKGKSSWCYHRVCVALYTEWQRRLHPAQPAPVALGTLRTGTLPLSPTTVDERLAHTPDEAQIRMTVDGVDYPPHAPQEARMPDDEYIPDPEMDDAPIAALRPRTPQVDDLEAALQVWTAERAVVQRFLRQELKANIDYYTLRIGGKDSKPSLSKAGAEKVLGWLKLQASFTPDTGTWEMLGKPTDLVCYVCTIRTRSGEIVGEGRGARSLKKDNGDVNKAIKMAEKSACVSAVLRTGALSDVFTCDLEDMQEPEPARPTAPAQPTAPARPTGQESRQRIWAMVKGQAPDVTTREQVERWIKAETGYELHPDRYRDIIESLEMRA